MAMERKQVSNSERASRGGDVMGTDKTDVDEAVGSPIDVAAASYDPGYEMELGYCSEADLKRGFCSYGIAIGEGRPKGIIGGGR